MAESSEELGDLIQNLLRDLEISHDSFATEDSIDVDSEFGELLNATKSKRTIYFDASIMAASLGRWDRALDWCDLFLNKELTSPGVLAWKMRCCVELERFSEALALASMQEWPKEYVIHVKYLSGLCYLKLKMSERARLDFEYVERQDSGYRDVARMLARV
jgi:tetratricopeptide (TPR) repeat protein